MFLPTEKTNHYRYQVEKEFKNKSIRDILLSRGFSRRLISTVKRDGELLLNNKPVFFIENVDEGDIIDIYLPEEHIDTIPVEGPLNIVYEDSEVLIVNKPSMLVVHPTHDYQENTLANYVANYFKETGQDVKVRFVNRLDRDTTGLVVIAKNKFVHHYIQSMMKTDKVKKTYDAIVEGQLKEPEGIIDLPIYRPTQESIERIIDDRGLESQTKYKVLEDYGNSQKVECELFTGRTHQIRVHLKAVGNPIIGDPLYNPDSVNKFNFDRQALHSKRLELVLPKTGKKVFEAELQNDMKELENHLRSNLNE